MKTLWAGGRVSADFAAFHIDWDDLQLNVPNPAVPAQFFVRNVGGATSSGVELELAARAAPGVDVFAAFGYTHARFGPGSVSGPLSIDGNKLPNTPDHTVSIGGQYSRLVGSATVHARVDVVRSGAFQYNDTNSLGQEAYALVNLRGGYSARRWLAEVFVRNAFDTRYIPLAFAYPELRPLGLHGRDGRAAHRGRQRRRSLLAAAVVRPLAGPLASLATDRPLRLRLGVRFASSLRRIAS